MLRLSFVQTANFDWKSTEMSSSEKYEAEFWKK